MKFRPILIAAATIGAIAVLLAVGACGDLPSQPNVALTPAEIAKIRVAVAEARDRLMIGISSETVRKQVGADLDALDASAVSGNASEVRLLARRTATTLVAYHWSSDEGDGPDISAMLLMLNSVASTAGNTSPDISL